MPASMTKSHTIREHFEGKDPKVRAAYEAIVTASRHFGPMLESPKKTSIHLDRKSAFAGVATRKAALIVTLLLVVVLAGLVFLGFALLPQVPMRFWQVLGICVVALVVLWWFTAGQRKASLKGRTRSRPSRASPNSALSTCPGCHRPAPRR